MSTDGDNTQAARSSGTQRTSDPLQMSAAEKCVAEWEARHDVAARGRRADPEALQHYAARSRLGPPTRPHVDGASAPQAHDRHGRPAPIVEDQRWPRPGSVLDWLLRRPE